MIKARHIEAMKSKLVETYNPLAIYLFGSYAWGKPNEHSDLDFMIVVSSLKKSRHRMIVNGHKALDDFDVAKDIVLFSKKEFDKRAADKMTLCFKVKVKGVQIYVKT